MITHYIPYPLYSGAAIRNYNMLKRLSREHEVWVAGFASQEADAKNIAHLRSFCAGVETVEFTDSNALQYPLLALEYFTKGWPTELRHYRSQALIEKIGSLVAKHHFDVVEIEDSFMGLYLEALPISMHRNCLITFHDIVFSKANCPPGTTAATKITHVVVWAHDGKMGTDIYGTLWTVYCRF
jgi:hypothetical protein